MAARPGCRGPGPEEGRGVGGLGVKLQFCEAVPLGGCLSGLLEGWVGRVLWVFSSALGS